jgi:hypothetical protein
MASEKYDLAEPVNDRIRKRSAQHYRLVSLLQLSGETSIDSGLREEVQPPITQIPRINLRNRRNLRLNFPKSSGSARSYMYIIMEEFGCEVRAVGPYQRVAFWIQTKLFE